MEGLRRLLPEPAPSPRPCIACQGATPGKHIETNMTFCQLPSKQDISTWQAVGHFYLALTCYKRRTSDSATKVKIWGHGRAMVYFSWIWEADE